ncbi:MAG: hypothetical protein EON48_06940 [Acetobacteraceae bacterium]|nr:MAG: hypothetical protein EON48_06940 [Acetobacteraceae bacterium]
MLRILIGTGLLLMTVGFGAAGWQYWKTSQPAAATQAAAPVLPGASAEVAKVPPPQIWLASPTGGLVPQDDVVAYLRQDRFVPARTLRVLRQASLGSLLADGEKLPEAPFLQVLADIRAPRVAEGLCAVLTRSVAKECAVHSARVVDASVDPVAGTAMFQLELVYRLDDTGDELPDLATHVLRKDEVLVDLQAGDEGTASSDAALDAVLAAVDAACKGEGVGAACRPLRLSLDWKPGAAVSARAEIAWLDPLPTGMSVVPPLDTVPGG